MLTNLCKIFTALILLGGYSAAQDCKAKIMLSSDIEEVDYYIDSLKTGSGKSFESEVSNGSHIIRAVEKNNIWSPMIFIDTVIISNCKDYKFSYSFSSMSWLRSNPPDAYVYRNDSLIGYTPLLLSRDDGSLVLRKAGYKDITVAGTPAGAVILEQAEESNGKLFYQKSLFRYLLGGLVVLGGTTAYFKLKADKKYDRYEITGDKNLLDETHRYDLISGITFGALQVNFGLLLYYFLTD